MATSSDTQQQLAQLCEGWLFPSETDAPVTPFHIASAGSDPSTPENFLQVQKLPADTPIQSIEFGAYFAPRLQEREGQDPMQRETIRHLRALVEWMQANLATPRVYKVGNISYDIYALGKTADGTWEGVHTQSVET